MAIRELVTVLGYQLDNTGAREFEQSLSNLKKTALNTFKAIGSMMVAELSISSIKAVWAAGKEFNLLGKRIQAQLRPGEDINAALEGVFRVAQETTSKYSDVAEQFRVISAITRDMNVSTTENLQAIGNIQRALEIDRATTEESQAAINTINMALRMGRLTERHLAALIGTSPRAVQLLQEAFGAKTQDNLRELAKQGKITGEALVKAFSRQNRRLLEDHAKVPLTLGKALTYARNELIRLFGWFQKGTTISSWMGRSIVWLTDTIMNFGRTIVEMLGGAENALRIFQIALITAIGAGSVALVMRFSAALMAMGRATLFALGKWILIGVAIAAVALAIEDFIGYMQGKESVFGEYIDPQGKVRAGIIAIKDAFVTLGSAIKQAFAGDASGLEKITLDVVNRIGAEFKQFGADLEKGINEDIKNLQKLGTALGFDMSFMDSWSVENAKTGIKNFIKGLEDSFIEWKNWFIENVTFDLSSWTKSFNEWKDWFTSAEFRQSMIDAIKYPFDTALSWLQGKLNEMKTWIMSWIPELPSWLGGGSKDVIPAGPPDSGATQKQAEESEAGKRKWYQKMGDFMPDVSGMFGGSKVSGPIDNSITAPVTFNPTIQVTAELNEQQIAEVTSRAVRQAGDELVADIGRQMQRSNPKTETGYLKFQEF